MTGDRTSVLSLLSRIVILAAFMVATVLPGTAGAVTFSRGDLDFVLDQIKFSERHAQGEDLREILPNAHVPWGLRTVDGSFNNLFTGQEHFGAADLEFPASLTTTYRDTPGVVDLDGPGPMPAISLSYAPDADGHTTDVFDPAPRMISELIVNQSTSNPAALDAAEANEDSSLVGTDISGREIIEIPNVAADEGLSAPFNAFFTFFGQFFDHGLDLVNKGGSGHVFMPLAPDDPLFVEGSNTNFMLLTRATREEGGDPVNATTPWVDQNQTYSSHPSAQVLLRAYELNAAGAPEATGSLINGAEGGMATWTEVKEQARTLLGIELDDFDGLDLPLIAADPYGDFMPGDNGFPMIVTAAGDTIEGNPAAPVDASQAARIAHNFLIDIAHASNPIDSRTGDRLVADGDMIVTPPGAPAMGTYDDELLGAHYICGDGRCNENIALTSIHHVFHSEHNRIAEQVKSVVLGQNDLDFLNEWLETAVDAVPADGADLDWDGNRIFQAAKYGTEMQYNRIIFDEFSPRFTPLKDVFLSYQPSIQPSIVAEFAHTVYRFGHSMLTETVQRFDPDFVSGEVSLVQAFLNPVAFDQSGTLTPEEAAGSIIRGITRTRGNQIDEFVTGALQNNLLGLPLDLPAINIARGRDTGVPTLNAARREFFANTGDVRLKPYTSWTDLLDNLRNETSIVNFIAAYGAHPTVVAAETSAGKRAAAMDIVFPSDTSPADSLDFLNSTGEWESGADGVTTTGIDEIDFWVGGLAEEIMPFGSLLGSTFNFVFETQMENLQNGDRFYYVARNIGLNFLAELESNSFTSIVMRNTDLGELNAGSLPLDIFSSPTHWLEVDQSQQFNQDAQDAEVEAEAAAVDAENAAAAAAEAAVAARAASESAAIALLDAQAASESATAALDAANADLAAAEADVAANQALNTEAMAAAVGAAQAVADASEADAAAAQAAADAAGATEAGASAAVEAATQALADADAANAAALAEATATAAALANAQAANLSAAAAAETANADLVAANAALAGADATATAAASAAAAADAALVSAQANAAAAQAVADAANQTMADAMATAASMSQGANVLTSARHLRNSHTLTGRLVGTTASGQSFSTTAGANGFSVTLEDGTTVTVPGSRCRTTRRSNRTSCSRSGNLRRARFDASGNYSISTTGTGQVGDSITASFDFGDGVILTGSVDNCVTRRTRTTCTNSNPTAVADAIASIGLGQDAADADAAAAAEAASVANAALATAQAVADSAQAEATLTAAASAAAADTAAAAAEASAAADAAATAAAAALEDASAANDAAAAAAEAASMALATASADLAAAEIAAAEADENLATAEANAAAAAAAEAEASAAAAAAAEELASAQSALDAATANAEARAQALAAAEAASAAAAAEVVTATDAQAAAATGLADALVAEQAAIDASALADAAEEATAAASLAAADLAANSSATDDPADESDLIPLIIRNNANSVEYTGGDHVVIGGTDEADTIIGGIGDDTIFGHGGDDTIEGGDGADLIQAGPGDDIITDLAGPDVIEGGPGCDAMSGGNDENVMFGDEGNDFILGGDDLQEVFGGTGDDFIWGSPEISEIFAGEGDDWIENPEGGENVLGGDNFVNEDISQPVFPGNDVIIMYDGLSDMHGEAGDDILVDGASIDRMEGANGFDWSSFQNDIRGVTADLNLDLFTPPIVPPSQATFLNRYDRIEGISGSPANDVLIGTEDDEGAAFDAENSLTDFDLISGYKDGDNPLFAADTVSFEGGEILLGGLGHDRLEGRGGDDLLDGDAHLRVQIQVDSTGERVDSMMDIQARVFTREISPCDLSIVREIITTADPDGTDTAVYRGDRADYVIEGGDVPSDVDGDGYISVSDTVVPGDGTDRVRNIERLAFADETVLIGAAAAGASGSANQPPVGQPTVSGNTALGDVLTASIAGVTDADNRSVDNPTGAVSEADVSFRWQSAPDGVFIDILRGADEATVTGSTLEVTAAEVGLDVRVIATFTDAAGVIESTSSEATNIPNPAADAADDD